MSLKCHVGVAEESLNGGRLGGMLVSGLLLFAATPSAGASSVVCGPAVRNDSVAASAQYLAAAPIVDRKGAPTELGNALPEKCRTDGLKDLRKGRQPSKLSYVS